MSQSIKTGYTANRSKFMKTRISLFLLLWLLIAHTVFANELVFTPINTSHGLSDNQIRFILQLPDGRMVFTTYGNVNIYDGARFRYIHRTAEHLYPLSGYDGYYRIYQSQDQLLWIKDYRKLMCLDLQTEKYIPDLESYFKNKKIEGQVNNLFIDSQKKMWLLTSGGLLQPDSSLLIDLSANKGELQDLDSDGVNLFLFYNTGEIVCHSLEANEVLYTVAAYPANEQENYRRTSLVIKGKTGFYQLRNGIRGGFFFFDLQSRRWKKLLDTNYPLNTLIVTPDETTAYISTRNGIWITSLQTQEKKFLPSLKTQNGDTISTEISTLYIDMQGGLWTGTLNRGLLYYHPSRYKLKYIGRSSFPEPSYREIFVQAFAEDASGNIYIKCQQDFYNYIPNAGNGRMLQKVNPSSIPDSVFERLNLPTGYKEYNGKQYTSVCNDTREWTWAGTPDGLYLFVPGRPERILYTEDGLSNNFVHAILEDKKQNIWVTTSHGISQILPDSSGTKIHFTNYNTYDGTLEGEYLNSSIYQSTDETLYFGGIDGFNVFYPQDSTNSFLPYKPVFTYFGLRGEEIETGKIYDERIILKKSTAFTNEIELAHNQNFLNFEFSALNYRNPAHTYYRYRMDGIDTDWNETYAGGKINSTNGDGILRLQYTNLPYGKYTLMVMASDNPYRWPDNMACINIVIYAPWWKTPLAFIFYSISFLIITGGCIYLYIRVTRKKLEYRHKEEILLMRIRNLIEQLNGHETEFIPEIIRENGSGHFPKKKEVPLSNQKDADTEFIKRAIEMVEKNLNTPGYSVGQLSRDLCMERTGLYKKLTAILDESPSLFIRNIRLQRAARLLLENKLSITDIAANVGFSSTSYMSKCFQEIYGCRPSEYASKIKNQHN